MPGLQALWTIKSQFTCCWHEVVVHELLLEPWLVSEETVTGHKYLPQVVIGLFENTA